MTAIDARLDALLETAAKKEPSYADFLVEVMNTEADARRQRYLKARLQLAIPWRGALRNARLRFTSRLHFHPAG
jgi:hypothetical protein